MDLNKKRQILTEYFLSNKKNIPKFFFKESKVDAKNIKYTHNSQWTSLLEGSRKIQCDVSIKSFDQNSYGFDCNDEQAQNILESAIRKKIDFLLLQNDLADDEQLYSKLYSYLVDNRHYKKPFYNFIRKIYLVDNDQLPNED